MDATKWPPHSRPMRPNVTTHKQRRCPRIDAASRFFFFPISRYAPTQAKSIISGETAETHQFKLYQRQTSQFKQKFKTKKKKKTKQNKKKAQNVPFELNNKTLNYLNSQNAPFFSLQLSLTFCSPSPLSHRRTRSLPKTHSHSPILCMTLSLKLTSPHQPTLNSGIKLIKAFNLSFSILSSLYSHML